METNWCNCKEHNSRDFKVLTDFYCAHFIPNGWMLDCQTLDATDDSERNLFLTGYCSVCKRFMRSGTSLPVNFSGDSLINQIYIQMQNYRPYDYKDNDGIYRGFVVDRLIWYREQDDLPQQTFDEVFISLFCKKDVPMVQSWLERTKELRPVRKPAVVQENKTHADSAEEPEYKPEMVTEYCPHCENEATMLWDIEKNGYKAFCLYCGKRLMLCSKCLYPEENCDYSYESCYRL